MQRFGPRQLSPIRIGSCHGYGRPTPGTRRPRGRGVRSAPGPGGCSGLCPSDSAAENSDSWSSLNSRVRIRVSRPGRGEVWGRRDSNPLRRWPPNLQSGPALPLRRSPGREPLILERSTSTPKTNWHQRGARFDLELGILGPSQRNTCLPLFLHGRRLHLNAKQPSVDVSKARAMRWRRDEGGPSTASVPNDEIIWWRTRRR